MVWNQMHFLAIAFCLAPAIGGDLFRTRPMDDAVHGDFLDQRFEGDVPTPKYNTGYSSGQINSYQEWAETFTVGMSGTLSHVEVFGSAPWFTDVSVNIYKPTDDGYWQLLCSRTLWPGNPTNFYWHSFDFRDAGIEMHQGDQFAIGMSGRFEWISSQWSQPNRTYEGGAVYTRLLQEPGSVNTLPIGWWYPLNGTQAQNDLMFRTFMIPEPSSATLLLLGMLGCGWRRRR